MYVTIVIDDDAMRAEARITEFPKAHYPGRDELMRKNQAWFAQALLTSSRATQRPPSTTSYNGGAWDISNGGAETPTLRYPDRTVAIASSLSSPKQ